MSHTKLAEWTARGKQDKTITMGTILSKDMIGRSAFWSILNQGTGQILVLLVFLVTARFVDKEDFGVMAVALMTVEAFRQVFIDSLTTGIYAQRNPSDKYYNTAFLVAIAGSIASAAIIFMLSNPIADILNDPAITDALRWISLLLIAIGLSKVQESWLGKNYHFKVLALRSIVSIVIGGGIGIIMAVQGYGIMALIAQQLVTALIAGLWLWIATPWKPRFDTDEASLHLILNEGRYNASTGLIRFVDGQSDIFFSSYSLGAAATGVYNAAKRIVTAISLILNSGLNSVALPAMASFSNDQQRTADNYLKCVYYSTVLTAPLYIGFIATSPDLIYVLLGDKWTDTAPIACVLAFAAFINCIGQYNGNILLVSGKANWNMHLALAGAVLNLALLIIFAKHGLMAIACALMFKTLIFYPITTGITLRLLKINPKNYLFKVFPPVCAGTIMGLCVYALSLHFPDLAPWQRVLMLVPTGGILYTLFMFIIDHKSFADIRSAALQTWNNKQ